MIVQPSDVIKGALSTEKAVRGVDSKNMLVFIVDKRASKTDVKKSLEVLYSAKVLSVNTTILNGRKKAFVTFSKETSAKDIATALGVM